MKPHMPDDKKVVGMTRPIPFQDTDEKFIMHDLQGESLYTNPPDPNLPCVDHGHDEVHIWNWQNSILNQIIVKNTYSTEFQSIFRRSHAPWWGRKFISDTWSKPEKKLKFMKQWQIRQDFEALKMKHATERRMGDNLQKEQQEAEVKAFLAGAEETMHQYAMRDVYVTDHVPKTKKYFTNSDEEDVQYFAYMKSLEDYNRNIGHAPKPLNHAESGKYERGSMLQRMFEPLAGAIRQDNGTLYLEVLDKDVADACNEETARKQYELLKDEEVLDQEDDALRAAIYSAGDKEAQVEMDALRNKMDTEFASFLAGDKYDYVTDMRKAYAEDLATPMAAKIFKTIPAHTFYDIKTPRQVEEAKFDNPINPARAHPNVNFFEMRKLEDWQKNREEKRNIVDGISTHGNY